MRGPTKEQTFVEKVFSEKLGREVRNGEIVELTPDVAMSRDNTAAISLKFKEIDVHRGFSPQIHVIIWTTQYRRRRRQRLSKMGKGSILISRKGN